VKINNVILRTVAQLVVFIILTLAIYLFFSGHHSPGGGFVGGLVLAAAFVLLFIVYDIEQIKKAIPLDFKKVAAFGAFLSVFTGLGAVFFGSSFLTQAFGYFNLPIFGETELATVTLFEAGVALAVVGVVCTIMLSITESEDV
jgi:multicomponent Na+:H+ antiporter subunit B